MHTTRAALLGYFSQRNRGWVLSLLAAVFLVYLPFLNNPFVFDDLNFFSWPTSSQDEQLANFGLRWIPYTTLVWTRTHFGDAPPLFRLGNLLLHATNVLLLFFWLRQLVLLVATPAEAKRAATWGAWLGALFFACNPVAVYATGYLIQLSILMATMFTLVMFLGYCQGVVTGQKRWLVLAVAAYFLACFSKEHCVLAPAITVALSILLRSKAKIAKHALWFTWVAFFIIGCSVVYLRSTGVLGLPYETAFEVSGGSLFEQLGLLNMSNHVVHLLSVLTQAGLFFKYLLLWWWPNPAFMSVDMRAHFINSLAAWQGWIGGAAFVLYGVLAFTLLLRSRWVALAGLSLLYPWLFYGVEFSTIRVQEVLVLYRSYLWLPGLMLIFPLLLARFPSNKVIFALLGMVLSLIPLAWNRLWVFADPYRLWNDAAILLKNDNVPGADRIYYNRGNAALAAMKWGDAAKDYQRVISHSPKIGEAHVNLGMAYYGLKRYQEAIMEFGTSIALKPSNSQAYFGMGLAYKRLQNDDAALKQMSKSCELGNISACVIVASVRGQK